MKKVLYLDGTTETVSDEFALRLYEQGKVKGFAPVEETKEEPQATETKKKGK